MIKLNSDVTYFDLIAKVQLLLDPIGNRKIHTIKFHVMPPLHILYVSYYNSCNFNERGRRSRIRGLRKVVFCLEWPSGFLPMSDKSDPIGMSRSPTLASAILLLRSAFACEKGKKTEKKKKKLSDVVPGRGPGRIFREEGEGGECIFKIVTMQFRWRIHNESLSRERGAPACPVNINLSAQWSYHEETRKKFRCSTDGGCIVIPRAPAQQRPFVQCSVAGCCCCCRGAMNESVRYWRRKRKNNDIVSNHHAGWVSGRRGCSPSPPSLPPSFLLSRSAILTRSLIGERVSTLPVHPPRRCLDRVDGIARSVTRLCQGKTKTAETITGALKARL